MAIGAMYAGDFIIREALLISPTGSIADLLKDVAIVEINIFEDIMKSSLTGSIIIGDTNNVVSLLPIVGQEYLTLKLETPTFLEIFFIFFRRVFDSNPSVPNFFDKLIFEKWLGTEILK